MSKISSSGQEDITDQIKVRLETIEKILRRKENPYKNGFKPTHSALELHEKYENCTKDELVTQKNRCSVTGRIMAIRDFGKAAFLRLNDRSGSVQLFVRKDSIGENCFVRFKEMDVGDIIYSAGEVFRTKTDELSIHCSDLVLLSKSLRPLPEKFHGLTDVEVKYRQRYLDLIMNLETRERFIKRSKIIESVRKFFIGRDFIEVETPMMHPIAGGAIARPFKTHHNTLDMPLYLRIAPELYLKRLLVGGLDRVFEINRNFRNEGISIQHNPEFTMIEFYQAYSTFEDLITLTEDLFKKVAMDVLGKTKLVYQGTEIDLGNLWSTLTVEEAIVTYTDFKNKDHLRDKAALLEYGKGKAIPMDSRDSVGKLMMSIFEAEVESQLIQPTFVTHYPLDISPLSRQNEADPFLVDRFELYIYGREIANAFSELNDPFDQKMRFLGQVEAKQRGDEEACDMDEDYITALEYGMPPAAGEGIGIDRMVMLLTDAPSIRDVILFPQLRPPH